MSGGGFMRCPFCENEESKVLDSRPFNNGSEIKRRRECLKCGARFTTFERIERLPVVVIKRDSSRQLFDSNKLLGGMIRACEKRPVSLDTLNDAIIKIENRLYRMEDHEISSEKLGEMALEQLRGIDEIAYIRFASVYHDFKDIRSFTEELERMRKENVGE